MTGFFRCSLVIFVVVANVIVEDMVFSIVGSVCVWYANKSGKSGDIDGVDDIPTFLQISAEDETLVTDENPVISTLFINCLSVW